MIYRLIIIGIFSFLISCSPCEDAEYHFSGDWLYIGQLHLKNKGDTIVFNKYYRDRDTLAGYVFKSIWKFKSNKLVHDLFEHGGTGLEIPSKYSINDCNILKLGNSEYQIISKSDSLITLVKRN